MVITDIKVLSIEAAKRAIDEIRNWIKDFEKKWNTRYDTVPPYGVLLTDKVIAVTSTRLLHNLGKKYTGYIVVKSNTQATFKEEAEASKKLYLSLSASAEATVDIWIF